MHHVTESNFYFKPYKKISDSLLTIKINAVFQANWYKAGEL